jgi:hypothetical protein
VTRVVILVPWRTDNGHRERLWGLAKARWQALFPDWPIYEGAPPPGEWNRSAALNDAAKRAGKWDMALVIDADVILSRSQVARAVETAEALGKVTWAFRQWGELTQDATERLLASPDEAMVPELDPKPEDVKKVNPIAWSNCFAVPRKVWDALGGFDERFVGWGGEDTAFAAAVQGLHGWERIEGTSWNLWHEPSGRKPRTRDYAWNMRLRDRYAFALRRDHQLHDRDREPRPGEHLQDMYNHEEFESHHTVRRFCYCGECARKLGLPDWSRWWPTLEELVARTLPAPEVALVVHTGGAPETWPQRSAYLRASLASLNERLKLTSWERRVIWSDWGDTFREPLEAIAAEYGFYLPSRLTPESRLGYAGSMQAMWRYIRNMVRATYVFQTEDDFDICRDVDVAAMASVLDANPELVQMALLRAPISDRERQRGTILGYPPSDFSPHEQDGHQWLEHNHFFTCNPSLFRTSLTEQAWPSGDHSEAVYGRRLFASGLRSALWGEGETWIEHTGKVRAGGPY